MSNIIRFCVIVILFTSVLFAQNDSKVLSQKPDDFNNTLVTTTPGDALNGTLNESFEDATFPPTGWSRLSPDGGTGWERDTVGTTPFPGWQGGTIISPPDGGDAVAYATWITGGQTSNDQWLVTPQITNVQAGDELSFWMWFPFSNYVDSVDVLISTTDMNPSDFNIVVEQFYLAFGSTDTSWAKHTYTLTDYVSAGSDIYIAWREHVSDNFNDGAIVCLDLVEVTGTSPAESSSLTIPDEFSLEQNYPNPFNPSTQIIFNLSEESNVILTIFNLLGEKILEITNADYSAGTHKIDFNASGLNSGVYFYRINAVGVDGASFSSVKKMILTK